MIDNDLARLMARDEATDLKRLERDVWHREAALQALAGASRRLASLQGLVLAAAMVTSASLGIAAATSVTQHAQTSPFAVGSDLAPSTLLFGSSR